MHRRKFSSCYFFIYGEMNSKIKDFFYVNESFQILFMNMFLSLNHNFSSAEIPPPPPHSGEILRKIGAKKPKVLRLYFSSVDFPSSLALFRTPGGYKGFSRFKVENLRMKYLHSFISEL